MLQNQRHFTRASEHLALLTSHHVGQHKVSVVGQLPLPSFCPKDAKGEAALQALLDFQSAPTLARPPTLATQLSDFKPGRGLSSQQRLNSLVSMHTAPQPRL